MSDQASPIPVVPKKEDHMDANANTNTTKIVNLILGYVSTTESLTAE